MKTFYQLLANVLLVGTKNNFVWFALTYWIYLETQSVLSTGILGGIFLVGGALSSFWFGSLVDRFNKKHLLLASSGVTFVLFSLGLLLYNVSPESAFTTVSSLTLWMFVVLLMGGVMTGGIFNIAVPTLITHLVSAENRDKANGLFGTVIGISFALTSVASGISLAYFGMQGVLLIALALTLVAMAHLSLMSLPEPRIEETEEEAADTRSLDIKGTIKIVASIPGLFALIFFTTFNNLLGGVFMALMDAYGLSLVSVQVWGILWGFLSLGFILGGIIIAKRGLGENPVRQLFRINIVTWTSAMLFTVQPSIVLLAVGVLVWITLMPFIEATEQTIIQKVVPPKRQGRVFGFAHSVEQAASPLTAFLIGPIAQFFFIPFMTTGAGVDLVGDWFGVGTGRGIALVFTVTGLIGLLVTLVAMRSPAYQRLAKRYAE